MQKRGNRYRTCVYMSGETVERLKWLQKAKAIEQGVDEDLPITKVISLLINEEYDRFWKKVQ